MSKKISNPLPSLKRYVCVTVMRKGMGLSGKFLVFNSDTCLLKTIRILPRFLRQRVELRRQDERLW